MKILILMLAMINIIATILLIVLQKRYDASLDRISVLNQKLIDMSGKKPMRIKVQKMIDQFEIENYVGDDLPISDIMFEEFKQELQKVLTIDMEESMCGNIIYGIDTMVYDLNDTQNK